MNNSLFDIPAFDPIIVVPTCGLLILLCLPAVRWIFRHTNLLSMLRHHLRRFAPLYFVVGPSAITYIAVCGSASVGGIALFFLTHRNGSLSQAYANQHGIYTLFHCIEYGCSFFGALFFAWLIRWVGLPRWWMAMLLVSMGLSAAYRTARVGTDYDFGSGPEILRSPQWLDTIPVILGFCLFLLLFQQHSKRNGQSLPNPPREDTNS